MFDKEIIKRTVEILKEEQQPISADEICKRLKKRRINICSQKLGVVMSWHGKKNGFFRILIEKRYRRYNVRIWGYYLGMMICR